MDCKVTGPSWEWSQSLLHVMHLHLCQGYCWKSEAICHCNAPLPILQCPPLLQTRQPLIKLENCGLCSLDLFGFFLLWRNLVLMIVMKAVTCSEFSGPWQSPACTKLASPFCHSVGRLEQTAKFSKGKRELAQLRLTNLDVIGFCSNTDCGKIIRLSQFSSGQGFKLCCPAGVHLEWVQQSFRANITWEEVWGLFVACLFEVVCLVLE